MLLLHQIYFLTELIDLLIFTSELSLLLLNFRPVTLVLAFDGFKKKKIFFLFKVSGGRRDQLIFVLGGLRSDENRRSFAT